MKHLKRFEKLKNKKFDVGDYVTIQVDVLSSHVGETGIVEKSDNVSCHILFSDDSIHYYWINELRFATEEEIENYNIKSSKNKYNL